MELVILPCEIVLGSCVETQTTPALTVGNLGTTETRHRTEPANPTWPLLSFSVEHLVANRTLRPASLLTRFPVRLSAQSHCPLMGPCHFSACIS